MKPQPYKVPEGLTLPDLQHSFKLIDELLAQAAKRLYENITQRFKFEDLRAFKIEQSPDSIPPFFNGCPTFPVNEYMLFIKTPEELKTACDYAVRSSDRVCIILSEEFKLPTE